MKRRLTLLISLIVILVALLAVKQYFDSRQKLSLIIKNPAGSVSLDLYEASESDDALYKASDSLRSITSTETFSVPKGNYVLVPRGEHIETASISLVVGDKPVTETIDIPYTRDYLDQLLASESPAADAAIKSAYPDVAADYTIGSGKLFGRGEWYATTLTNKQGPLENVNGDTLRVLLQKKADGWTVISQPPAIILTAPEYRQVPLSVLEQTNQL